MTIGTWPASTSAAAAAVRRKTYDRLAAERAASDGLPVGASPVVLSLTASQLRRAADWMTVMANKRGQGAGGRTFPLPMFANVFRLSVAF